ncbi:MAG: hypothetical protein AB8B56_10670 [Crocinitomicaceae bacterium]
MPKKKGMLLPVIMTMMMTETPQFLVNNQLLLHLLLVRVEKVFLNFELISEWLTALDQENNAQSYDEIEEMISNDDYSREVRNMAFCDGANFRTENPYPDWNDPNIKQEKLRGLRNRKITLHDLFDDNDIHIPQIIDESLILHE